MFARQLGSPNKNVSAALRKAAQREVGEQQLPLARAQSSSSRDLLARAEPLIARVEVEDIVSGEA